MFVEWLQTGSKKSSPSPGSFCCLQSLSSEDLKKSTQMSIFYCWPWQLDHLPVSARACLGSIWLKRWPIVPTFGKHCNCKLSNAHKPFQRSSGGLKDNIHFGHSAQIVCDRKAGLMPRGCSSRLIRSFLSSFPQSSPSNQHIARTGWDKEDPACGLELLIS